MLEEVYRYETLDEYRYEFTSLSETKSVRKVVLFTATEHQNLYNLALLDILESGQLCDKAETKNQDMRKVLATTYNIIECFLALNKAFRVVFAGSEEKRQRLYRIAISNNINGLSEKYIIFGLTEEYVEHFRPNRKYDHYIIANKL